MTQPRRPRTLPVAALLAAALLLAACGGAGSNPPPDSTQPPSGSSNFLAASVVIGQPDFTSEEEAATVAADTLSSPRGNPGYDPATGRLYLADTESHRILIFDGIPTTSGAAADGVLGQANFTDSDWSQDRDGFFRPETVQVAGGKLIVADQWNSRILIWNSLPSAGEPADVLIGETGTGSCSPDRFTGMGGLFVTEAGKLIVADGDNNRVLIWNSLPTNDDQDPDLVLGQSRFDTCAADDDDQDGVGNDSPSARTLHDPADVWSDDQRLIVSDRNNNRVLIWQTFPTENFAPADVVLGQPDMTTGTQGFLPVSDKHLAFPTALTSDGTRLFLADNANQRVLVWDEIPTQNYAPAEWVLGQSDFTHRAPNDTDQDGVRDGPDARTLRNPSGLRIIGDRLLVADSGNNRYLIFDLSQ